MSENDLMVQAFDLLIYIPLGGRTLDILRYKEWDSTWSDELQK